MAQILRVYKPDIVMIARCYGTQRGQRNHYEILNVPRSASQKEIRHAFLQLSKKLHPDISGKTGHAEFVKINEAYSTLSKEDSRRQYDMNLRYSSTSSYENTAYSEYHRPRYAYRSHRQWEETMAGRSDSPYPNTIFNGISNKVLFVLLFAFGLLVEIISFQQSMVMREQMLRRSQQYARELQQLRETATNRTPEEEEEYFKALEEQYNRRVARARELRNVPT